MNKIKDVLDLIEAVDSTLLKQQLLAEHASGDLRLVVRAAFDPYLRFYLREVPPVKTASRSMMKWTQVWQNLLVPMSKRELSGAAAREAVEGVLEKLDEGDGEVLRRILKKDLRCGVGAKMVNAAWGPGFIPDFPVQLAARDTSRAEYPCYIEPKSDGMRVLAVVGGSDVDGVSFLSRGGRPIETMSAVAHSIALVFSPGLVLDGEARGGASFEDSLSSIKRGRAQEDKPVTYTVFDVMTIAEFEVRECRTPFRERRAHLSEVQRNLDALKVKNVWTSEFTIVNDEKEARRYHDACVQRKFEGAMLKKMEGTYDFKRTTSWIKMKIAETEDLEITGVKPGKGRNAGRLGALVLSRNGVTCNCGTGMTDEERDHLWKIRKTLPGKIAEVEFMRVTSKGRAREPRLVKIRDHKGERS
jgi:DNA ligase-1